MSQGNETGTRAISYTLCFLLDPTYQSKLQADLPNMRILALPETKAGSCLNTWLAGQPGSINSGRPPNQIQRILCVKQDDAFELHHILQNKD